MKSNGQLVTLLGTKTVVVGGVAISGDSVIVWDEEGVIRVKKGDDFVATVNLD